MFVLVTIVFLVIFSPELILARFIFPHGGGRKVLWGCVYKNRLIHINYTQTNRLSPPTTHDTLALRPGFYTVPRLSVIVSRNDTLRLYLVFDNDYETTSE